jgi:hypothetical protein
MDGYRDIYSHRHVTVVLKLTYTGKLQTRNVELIVNVLFYLEGHECMILNHYTTQVQKNHLKT